MANIRFEIEKELGILSESSGGWTKELNLVSWNDREAKYDIRDWAEDHESMRKGITLSKDEIVALRNILNKLEL